MNRINPSVAPSTASSSSASEHGQQAPSGQAVHYEHRSGVGGVIDHARDYLRPRRSVREQDQINRGLRRAALAGDEQGVASRLPRADLAALSRNGHSALHNAARSGSPAVTRLILEHGAQPNQPNPLTGQTALHYAVEAGSAAVINELARDARTADVPDHRGTTAHQLASEQAAGADPYNMGPRQVQQAAAAISARAVLGGERLAQMSRAVGNAPLPPPYPGVRAPQSQPLGNVARQGAELQAPPVRGDESPRSSDEITRVVDGWRPAHVRQGSVSDDGYDEVHHVADGMQYRPPSA